MLTTKLLDLHSKCTSALKMIQTVNERVLSQQSRLRQFDNEKDLFHIIRLTNLRPDIISSLEHHKKVKDRLVEYYVKSHMRLSEDALIKCSRYFDLVVS